MTEVGDAVESVQTGQKTGTDDAKWDGCYIFSGAEVLGDSVPNRDRSLAGNGQALLAHLLSSCRRVYLVRTQS